MEIGLNRSRNKSRVRNIHVTTIIFLALLLVFVGISVFIARKLNGGIIPDEGVHLNLSIHYSTSWGIPPDTAETYRLGYIGHKPFLYYWINGRAVNVLSLFIDSPSTYKIWVVLRLLNVVYAALTVIFGYLLARETIENRWWQLLPVFLLTNTLMFVFLSGGVNYDNLANLCSFAGIYLLVRVLNGKNFYLNSLGWLIWILAGTLVKISILPLIPIMGLVWLVYLLKNHRRLNFRPDWDWKTIGLLATLIVLVLINFSIFGANLLKYKTLSPACTTILTEEQCNQNPVIRRSTKIDLPEKLTLVDTFNGQYPDPAEWFLDYWIGAIATGILGVLGHATYVPTLIITLFRLLMIWAIFVMIRYWKHPTFAIGGLIAILIFYTLVLLRTNYEAELLTGFKHVGIQGRYIFPVIGVIYTLMVYYFATIKNKIMSWATLAFTIFLFLWGGPIVSAFKQLPTMLPKVSIPSNLSVGEIVGEVEISQDFISQCMGTIDQVELLFATYDRTNTFPISFRLTDLTDDKIIAEQTIPGETIENNAWRSFPISPLSGSMNKTYRITVTSLGSVPGNAITLWGSKTDVYPDGEMLIKGQSIGTDLSFRYQCTQPVFTGWFR